MERKADQELKEKLRTELIARIFSLRTQMTQIHAVENNLISTNLPPAEWKLALATHLSDKCRKLVYDIETNSRYGFLDIKERILNF